jgi:hypothetical protein
VKPGTGKRIKMISTPMAFSGPAINQIYFILIAVITVGFPFVFGHRTAHIKYV